MKVTVCFAAFLVTITTAQGFDRADIVGNWALDSEAHDDLLEGEFERLAKEYPNRKAEFREKLAKMKGRMYSDLTLREDGTFELSMGVIGGPSNIMNGMWETQGNHVVLAWGQIHKMDFTYDDGRLTFYEDGKPHVPGDGAMPMTLRRVSQLTHNIRNNIFNMIIKEYGPGKVFGILGGAVLVLIGLAALSGILKKSS